MTHSKSLHLPLFISPASYLRAGQFGLCEDQGGGVDGVSQLLLHQLVGLGCLADPGEEGGESLSRESCNYFHWAERTPLW